MKAKNKKTQLIILAGGKGERFGSKLPKQFIKIAGKTIIEHTIAQVEQSSMIDSIIIVVNSVFYDFMNEMLLKNHFLKVKKVICGGKTRQESSYLGIMACEEDTDKVLLHDAIRPFISQEIIEKIIRALDSYGAVDVAISCADTIIEVDENRFISNIPKRKNLMRGQTPQGFRKAVIEEAYRRYLGDTSIEVTDDCGIVKHFGLSDIYVVNGSEKNIKITYQEDIYLADKLFQISSLNNLGAVDENNVFELLKNKVGVVFGDSSGIGADIVRLLTMHDCTVFGFSRRNGGDICSYLSVEHCLKDIRTKMGRIDYVINTAGDLKIGKLETMPSTEIDQLIDVDYRGAINVTKASLAYLRETRGSLILFTSSSYTRGRAYYSIYSSAKAAVVNFVQAVAEEMINDGIRINVVNPERTNTPMRRRNFGDEPVETLLDSEFVAQAALRAVLANYTGQVIDVRRPQGGKPR